MRYATICDDEASWLDNIRSESLSRERVHGVGVRIWRMSVIISMSFSLLVFAGAQADEAGYRVISWRRLSCR